MKNEIGAGAIFSEDKIFRYALWRIWALDKPIIMYIGLNPSTANEKTNDHTITRLVSLTDKNGFGGFYMMNLFAFVTSYPKDLETCKDVVGENNQWLIRVSALCERVCFCWGAFRQTKERVAFVTNLFKDAYCFGKNKNGSPKHPLFLPSETKLVNY